MNIDYSKAFTEVVEILKYVSEEDLNKIPKSMIDMMQKKMDKNYEFKIDTTKSIKKQKLMTETKAIFFNIYRDYWASPEEKARILAIQTNELIKIEQEKRNLYNPDNIFKKDNITEENDKDLVVLEKENFIKKIWNNIKNIFSKERT